MPFGRCASSAFSLVAALALSSCQPPAPAALTAADLQAAEALGPQFVEAIRAGDMAAVGRLYADDAVLLPPNSPAVRGPAAIQEFFTAFPKVAELSLVTERIEGVGGLAYVHGRYVLQVAIEGAPVDSGKYLDVRKKQPDGSWKYVADMFSSDLPPAPPAPAAPAK